MTKTSTNSEDVYPFDLAAHDALTALGYRRERIEEDWEDVGGPESGPDLVGGPAADIYEDADSRVVITERGWTSFEWRDLEMEKYVEAMGVACDAYRR